MSIHIVYPPSRDTDTDTDKIIYPFASDTKFTATGYLQYGRAANSATYGCPIPIDGTITRYAWIFNVTGFVAAGSVAIRMRYNGIQAYVDNAINITANGVYQAENTNIGKGVISGGFWTVELVKNSGTFTCEAVQCNVLQEVKV